MLVEVHVLVGETDVGGGVNGGVVEGNLSAVGCNRRSAHFWRTGIEGREVNITLSLSAADAEKEKAAERRAEKERDETEETEETEETLLGLVVAGWAEVVVANSVVVHEDGEGSTTEEASASPCGNKPKASSLTEAVNNISVREDEDGGTCDDWDRDARNNASTVEDGLTGVGEISLRISCEGSQGDVEEVAGVGT